MEPKIFKTQRLSKTMACLLDECKNMRELKQIHSQIITSPNFSPPKRFFLISRLLFFCALSSSGSLRYASIVFRQIKNPNLFLYNAMIRGYACNAESGIKPCSWEPLVLYKQMLSVRISPDCITIPFLLKNCSTMMDSFVGQSVHAHVVKFGLSDDVYVGNSLMGFYSGCGVLACARRVFDEMPERDIVSWNSMIIGCLRSGALDLAIELFRKMEKRNIITWNSVITGLVQGGKPKDAIGFFDEMRIFTDEDMIYPDKITIASVISACASLGMLDRGRWVHSYLVRSEIECDMVIATALIDMYGKCGNVESAARVFEGMPKKDVQAWTSIISVFALHGFGENAFDHFKKMVEQGVRPNAVTFVGLLTACAHSGLVERGRWCFSIMESVHSVEPQVQHYACMVDILSRAGCFREAEKLIASMPMDPDDFVWGALLGGCQMHGNVELGEKIAKHLIDLNPHNHAFHVTLCDIYAKAGRFDDLKRAWDFMNDNEIKKVIPGSSTIEVDGIVFEFSVRGSPEVMMDETRCILYCLSKEMKIDRGLLDMEISI